MAEPHKMKVHRLFHPSFLLLIFLCVSCSARVQPVGSPTVTAPPVLTNTPKPEGAAINRTATADWVLFQSTLSVLMTQVAVFQAPTHTPTRTRVPPTTTVYVTPRPTTPGEAKFADQNQSKVDHSPDMEWFWRTETEAVTEIDYVTTHIISADGTRDFYVHPNKGDIDLSASRYTPYFWLPGGRYVYMTGHACCIDSPPTHYWIRSLARFDLETGQLSMVLPWTNFNSSFGYSIGFSPDGKYLIWTEGWKPFVHVITLRNGNETLTRLDKKYSDIGITNWGGPPSGGWSLNKKKVILETYSFCQPTSDQYCVKVAFVVISAETGNTQIIQNDITERINSYHEPPYQITWQDDNHIQLIVEDTQQIIPVNLP